MWINDIKHRMQLKTYEEVKRSAHYMFEQLVFQKSFIPFALTNLQQFSCISCFTYFWLIQPLAAKDQ